MKKILILIALSMLSVMCASCTNSSSGNTDNVSTGSSNTGSAIAPVDPISLSCEGMKCGSGTHMLVEFADFQCPACIQTNAIVMPIFEEYAAAGKLTIQYRQYPLTSIHQNAYDDALAAFCAADQDKYFDYSKELYNLEQRKWTKSEKVQNSEREEIAVNLGLDQEQFASCLSEKTFEKELQEDIAIGDSLGIKGTPTLYLDGIAISAEVYGNPDTLRKFLDTVISE